VGNFGYLLAGFAAGAIGVFAGMPDVSNNDYCQLYKVDQKAVTAYVLKPPVLETAKCEAFCPTPMVKPPVETESQKLTDEKPETIEPEKPTRARRHRRYRRYWR